MDTDTHDCGRFRSYEVAYRYTTPELATCTIVEAARATAAAPTILPYSSNRLLDLLRRRNEEQQRHPRTFKGSSRTPR